MTGLEIGLLGACGLLLVCPPKWDPLIRWKERRERAAEPSCCGDFPHYHPLL